MTANISFTFDYYPNDLTNVWFNMSNRGFHGTYFVAPETIDTAGGPTKDDMTLIKMTGHEIGVYTNTNMVTLYQNNRTTGYAKIKSLKDDMYSKGFPVVSLAPNQRAWNSSLAGMAQEFYNQVRVCNSGALVQTYPIQNKLNINDGAFASLGSATSTQSIKDAIDAAIAANGWIPFVIHKVGTVEDSYTISLSRFNEVLDYLQSKGSAVKVVPFRDGANA